VAYSRLTDANDLGGAAAIDAFTQSSDPWLVSVAMVSEGVDIRRLRSLVYATNVLAELSFRQIVGRVVRSDPANGGTDFGVVYLPADPRLTELASNITGSSQVKLPDPIVITDRKEQEIVRVFEDGEVSRGEFRPIGSEGRRGMVTDVTGRQVPAYLVELAERYIKATGSDLPAFEVALLASTDDRLLKRLSAMGPTVGNSDDEQG
jgi:superfamily II DNA or RNA helicase